MAHAARLRLTAEETARRTQAVRAQLRDGTWVYLGRHGKRREQRGSETIAILPYRSSGICVAAHDANPPSNVVGPARDFVRILNIPRTGPAVTEVFVSVAPLESISIDEHGALTFFDLTYQHPRQVRLDIDAPGRSAEYERAWQDAIHHLHGPVEDLPLDPGSDELLRTAENAQYRIEPGPTPNQHTLLDLNASAAAGTAMRIPIYALRRNADNSYAFVTADGVLCIGPVVEHVVADPIRPRPLECDARALVAALSAQPEPGPTLG